MLDGKFAEWFSLGKKKIWKKGFDGRNSPHEETFALYLNVIRWKLFSNDSTYKFHLSI